jgi:TolA-binding protein
LRGIGDGEMPEERTGQEPEHVEQPETGDQPETSETTDDEPFDRERAMSTIRKLRDIEKNKDRELGDLRTQLEQVQAQLQQHEDEKLSEQDKIQRRADEAEAKVAELETGSATREREYQETISDLRIEIEAAKQAFNDPLDAVRMIDRAALEYDDDGTPTNVGELLDKLVKDKPYLIASKASGNGVPPVPEATEPGVSDEEKRRRAYRVKAL